MKRVETILIVYCCSSVLLLFLVIQFTLSVLLMVVPVIIATCYVYLSSKHQKHYIGQVEKEAKVLFDKSPPSIMMVIDESSSIIDANQKALEFANSSYEEVIGATGGQVFSCVSAFSNPNGCGYSDQCDECVLRRSVANSLLSGKAYYQKKGELLSSIDGLVRRYDIRFSTELISDYPSKRILLTMEDITEQVKKEVQEAYEHNEVVNVLEDNLLKSNQQLETIFENTPTLLCLMNTKGEIVKMNKTRREEKYTMGSSQRFNAYDAIIDCLNTFSSEMDNGCNAYCQQCSVKQDIMNAVKNHDSIYRKEGSILSHKGIHDRIYVVYSVVSIQNNPERITLIAMEDVTEHRLARKAILAREIQYRALFESSRDGICLLNMEGYYLDANKAFFGHCWL